MKTNGLKDSAYMYTVSISMAQS